MTSFASDEVATAEDDEERAGLALLLDTEEPLVGCWPFEGRAKFDLDSGEEEAMACIVLLLEEEDEAAGVLLLALLLEEEVEEVEEVDEVAAAASFTTTGLGGGNGDAEGSACFSPGLGGGSGEAEGNALGSRKAFSSLADVL